MTLDELPVVEQVREFQRMVCLNPVVAEILERMPGLQLPDCWLAAGALFQTVWNVLSDRDPRAGILDDDINYFDASDLTWEAEDRAIKKAHRPRRNSVGSSARGRLDIGVAMSGAFGRSQAATA